MTVVNQLLIIWNYVENDDRQGFRQRTEESCRDGWCYEVIHLFLNVDEAKIQCKKRGGSLAAIAARKTHEFLKLLIYKTR